MYFYHVLLFHGAIDQLSNFLNSWCDPKVDNIMFQRDLLKDWLAPHLFQCGWYFNCPKNNTPTLEIPLKENIKPSFIEILASFAKTQVEGGRQKMASKGKGKLKEKVIKIPSFDAFVEVILNQTLQTTNDVRRERRTIIPSIFPTPSPSGVHSTQQGSFHFSPSHPSLIVVTSNRAFGFHHMVLPFSWHSIVATKILS
jgi:hypothetical protein